MGVYLEVEFPGHRVITFPMGKIYVKNITVVPWLVWLSWLGHHPINWKVWVPFPVSAHAQVAGSVPDQGSYER